MRVKGGSAAELWRVDDVLTYDAWQQVTVVDDGTGTSPWTPPE